MNNIEDITERFEDLLDRSKPIPFSDSLKINKRELDQLIYELKIAIPQSVKEAEDVIDNCHEYVDKAQKDADYILENAKMQASKMVSEHEVYIRAVDECENLKEQTEIEINDAITEAVKSIDASLSDINERVTAMSKRLNEEYSNTNQMLQDTLAEIYEIRMGLRG